LFSASSAFHRIKVILFMTIVVHILLIYGRLYSGR
jgi:hypothetical protein